MFFRWGCVYQQTKKEGGIDLNRSGIGIPTRNSTTYRYQKLPYLKPEPPFPNHHFRYPAVSFRGLYINIRPTSRNPAFQHRSMEVSVLNPNSQTKTYPSNNSNTSQFWCFRSLFPIGSMGLVYLPTFTIKNQPNVGKYSIHGSYGFGSSTQKSRKNLCGFSLLFAGNHLRSLPFGIDFEHGNFGKFILYSGYFT